MIRSLLIVDDDDDMRTTLRHFLADEGFRVHTARNGQEALTRLQEIDPPGLILLDLMMPVMNGSDFLTVRSGNPKLAKIPVVVLSAWTRDRTGAASGAEDVLIKPINPELLLQVVERYCDRDARPDSLRR